MIRDAFNWLAAKPSSQYTLGGDEHSFKMNRAGRLVERVVSIPPMAVGALAMIVSIPTLLIAPPAAAAMFTVGALSVAFGKATGLVKGGIAHLIAKGLSSLANHVGGEKKAEAPKMEVQPVRAPLAP